MEKTQRNQHLRPEHFEIKILMSQEPARISFPSILLTAATRDNKDFQECNSPRRWLRRGAARQSIRYYVPQDAAS